MSLVVRRWTKHGKDRLYVTADGLKVGFLDLRTGKSQLDLPDLAEEFDRAVKGHLAITETPYAPLKPEGIRPPTARELTEHAKTSTLPARTFWAYARRET